MHPHPGMSNMEVAKDPTPLPQIAVPVASLEEVESRLSLAARDVRRFIDEGETVVTDADVFSDALRNAVQEIRDAFGCGSLDLTAVVAAEGGNDLDDLPALANDVRHAITQLQESSISDLSDAIVNVDHEFEYIERLSKTLVIDPSILQRADRITAALDRLHELGL